MIRARLPAVLLLLAWLPARADVLAGAIPPAGPAEDRLLTSDEAAAIAGRVLGLRVVELRADRKEFRIDADGFVDGRRCPLDGVRDVLCGEFAFAPASLRIPRAVLVGAVSGHLARNLVVAVEMASDEAGVAFGTLHGVLVFPGPTAGRKDRPAFAWYVGRAARALPSTLADVNLDGSLDLVYTYAQRLPGGRRIVARDVWTFDGMRAEKLISSGEKLSGVGTSTFDGVPLMEDGPNGSVRGAFRFVSPAPGQPMVGVFDRAVLAGTRSGFDLHVVADLGEGWREILSGAAPPLPGAVAPEEVACRPSEVPADASLELRRRLLDLETACSSARDAVPDGAPAPWMAPFRVVAALQLDASGLSMAAIGLRERAACDIALASPRAWGIAALLSLSAALGADRALVQATGTRCLPDRLDALHGFPVLSPLVVPADGLFGWMRRVAARWAPGT